MQERVATPAWSSTTHRAASFVNYRGWSLRETRDVRRLPARPGEFVNGAEVFGFVEETY
jgi:hypothetical protein